MDDIDWAKRARELAAAMVRHVEMRRAGARAAGGAVRQQALLAGAEDLARLGAARLCHLPAVPNADKALAHLKELAGAELVLPTRRTRPVQPDTPASELPLAASGY